MHPPHIPHPLSPTLFPSLQTNLDLSGNSIWGLEDINLLRKYCPDLTKLDLRGNPVAEAKPYKALAVRRLAMLTMLDGAPVR